MKRLLCLGAVLFQLVIWSACGGVFRPIIIPNPPQFPNPAAAHSVLTISDNGTVTGGVETPLNGSAMVIDVSGDTDVSQRNLGLVPIHAVQFSANQVFVANQSAPGANQESLNRLVYFGTAIANVSSISLPPGSAPNFLATTESANIYVSMPGYSPPSIAVVSSTQGTITHTFPVGLNPVAIVETPDTKKLYVANYGDGSIGAYNTQDRTARGVSSQPSHPPIWLAARNDSQRVYVLEANGTVAYLDTTTTSGPDTFYETSISVPGASNFWYDVILNRIYIPGNGALQIVTVSQSTPTTLANVPITTFSPSSRSTTDPCYSTTPGTLNVIAATSLPDATRAYVGSYYIDSADNVCPQVTVINATNFTVKTVIPIPGFPDAANPANPIYYVPTCANTRDQVGPMGNGFRIMMAAGGDSTRAYLSSCDGGAVNIVQTVTDTYYFGLPVPYSARNQIPPSAENPPQNPVFMIAGP
ncbi:MAG: YncE family protein [Bryobacteraceae bacterium]